MAGLVGYGSSDEEDEVMEDQHERRPLDKGKGKQSQDVTASNVGTADLATAQTSTPKSPSFSTTPSVPQQEPATSTSHPLPTTGSPQGPKLGPSLPPADGPSLPMSYEDSAQIDGTASPNSRPASPYTATRALLRDLTLPAVPNLDMPPSPPGSPVPNPALNRKFDTFLELKHKKGTHFNARLAQSAALRNPAAMDKLLGFVGLGGDESAEAQGTSRFVHQYATSLQAEIWDPEAFPPWAYRDRLKKAQEKVTKQKEEERKKVGRDAVEFVPASSSTAGANPGSSGSRQNSPGKRKTRS